MGDEDRANALVAVIGAGPAGLYAARYLADEGCHVVLINRDIKPGGLAEYGIYPNKLKMKNGLRRQFRSILDSPHISYFGNLRVNEAGPVTLGDLRELHFDLILVTVGAQGTKWLGLPGEELRQVYHAKDLVYHYNHLPPFSQRDYDIGQRIVCIGVGNVMLDVANWTVRDLGVDEVTAVARRGPAEVKFTKKEWQIVAANLDRGDFDREFARCTPVMEKCGQDVEAALEYILSGLERAYEPVSDTRFKFRFLMSPSRIVGDDEGNVTGLEVEDTTLEPRNGGTKAVKLGSTRTLECDTVIFCIGDRVDESFGLPVQWNEFAKHPEPRFPVEGLSYEAYDPEAEEPLDDVFLAGWSREASSGLVGAARKDGENGAKAVLQYLEAHDVRRSEVDLEPLESFLKGRVTEPLVRKPDVERLFEAEAQEAERRGVEEFKFDSNDEMLEALSLA